jgi:hypothetical protein
VELLAEVQIPAGELRVREDRRVGDADPDARSLR